jgi:hypothetical protein
MGHEQQFSGALAPPTLGVDVRAVADGIADPGGAARALGFEHAVLRAAPELAAGTPGYAPPPRAPSWITLRRGEREITVTPLAGGAPAARRVSRVEVALTEEGCCDAPACELKKTCASVWLVLEGGEAPLRLLVAEQRALVGAPAPAARGVARQLARFLGAPLAISPGAPPHDAPPDEALAPGEPKDDSPEPIGEVTPLMFEGLGRFALRSEGERVVLRALASAGPRATAPRNTLIGAGLAIVAALFWYELGARVHAGAGAGAAVVFGAGAALFSLAAYAFLGVARFSARYGAASSPLVAFGEGRFVVLPWVSRAGAVDLRPEGRLGAAIPLGELRAVSVKPRGKRFAVEFESDHGPIDALVDPREDVARFWAAALERVAAEARHPGVVTSARQRARARARGEAASPA